MTAEAPIAVVVGVGMSSGATAGEVRALVTAALARHDLAGAAVTVATRECFVDDPRLALGHPVIGHDDDALVAHSPPVTRTVGLPAQVAATAALLSAGVGSRLAGPVERSAHATVAVALPSSTSPIGPGMELPRPSPSASEHAP